MFPIFFKKINLELIDLEYFLNKLMQTITTPTLRWDIVIHFTQVNL